MAAGNNPEIEVTVSWSGSKWVFTDASDGKGNLLIDNIKGAELTLVPDGGTGVRVELVDLSAVDGPAVRVVDSSGAAVAGTIGALVKGH